jgi:hypothetical protein
MNKLISIFAIVLFFLASCGGNVNTSGCSGSDTHKHADGTEHSHDKDDTHCQDSIPEGQESFVVDEEENTGHSKDHKHNHDHPHTH